ncbi:MAG: hypothetical protein AAGG72_06465, partial [Pseudomonadota bacterium]
PVSDRAVGFCAGGPNDPFTLHCDAHVNGLDRHVTSAAAGIPSLNGQVSTASTKSPCDMTA